MFENAEELVSSIQSAEYDFNSLYAFKEKYVENAKSGNAETLAKFIKILMDKGDLNEKSINLRNI